MEVHLHRNGVGKKRSRAVRMEENNESIRANYSSQDPDIESSRGSTWLTMSRNESVEGSPCDDRFLIFREEPQSCIQK